MKRVFLFTLFFMAVIPFFVNSSRLLVGDQESNTTSQKIDVLPPEKNPPIKTKKDNESKPSLTSLKSESQNQTKLEPPVEPDKKNKTENNNTNTNTNTNINTNTDINNTVLSPPEIKKEENGTETGRETKKEGQNGNFDNGLCDDVASEKCHDDNNKWVACLKSSSNDSKELFLLVVNKGENEISLDINFTPSIILHTKKLHLSKSDSRKVNIIKTGSNQAANITLNSGKGDCILHITPSKTLISDWQAQFQQFTNYASTQFSPIYGLYFLLLTLLISLITFALCKFSKGRRKNPTAYQQLEMGERDETASSAAPHADVARDDVARADVADIDGWEKGWDDDWDDEEAGTGRGVSVNSFNSRGNSGNNNVGGNNNGGSKDGWDVDWDD